MLSLRVEDEHYVPVSVDLDPIAMSTYMAASQYVALFGEKALERRRFHGAVVHDMWSSNNEVRCIVTVVASAWIHVDLTTDPHRPTYCSVNFEIIDDRNDLGTKLLRASVPRSFQHQYAEQLSVLRRLNAISIAHWAKPPHEDVFRPFHAGNDASDQQYSPNSPEESQSPDHRSGRSMDLDAVDTRLRAVASISPLYAGGLEAGAGSSRAHLCDPPRIVRAFPDTTMIERVCGTAPSGPLSTGSTVSDAALRQLIFPNTGGRHAPGTHQPLRVMPPSAHWMDLRHNPTGNYADAHNRAGQHLGHNIANNLPLEGVDAWLYFRQGMRATEDRVGRGSTSNPPGFAPLGGTLLAGPPLATTRTLDQAGRSPTLDAPEVAPPSGIPSAGPARAFPRAVSPPPVCSICYGEETPSRRLLQPYGCISAVVHGSCINRWLDRNTGPAPIVDSDSDQGTTQHRQALSDAKHERRSTTCSAFTFLVDRSLVNAAAVAEDRDSTEMHLQEEEDCNGGYGSPKNSVTTDAVTPLGSTSTVSG